MKKDIRAELMRRVEDGERFTIDFEKRSLKIGKEVIIDDGELMDGYELSFDSKSNFINPLCVLEREYIAYRDSRPAEHEYGKYFKCKRAEELTDEELILGDNREMARAKLEWYVLALILIGFKFEDFDTDEKHWYWKSDSGLVLMRRWFGGK